MFFCKLGRNFILFIPSQVKLYCSLTIEGIGISMKCYLDRFINVVYSKVFNRFASFFCCYHLIEFSSERLCRKHMVDNEDMSSIFKSFLHIGQSFASQEFIKLFTSHFLVEFELLFFD